MEYLGQEGYLLFFDEILPEFTVGSYLASRSETLKVVYIDRDKGELGCLPASRKMRERADRLRNTYPDAFGAGDA